MRQVRFWIWENDGPIMLKLRLGQRVRWQRYTPHEEGFSAISRSWMFDGYAVAEAGLEWGRDCDGRIERGYERAFSVCPELGETIGPEIPDHPGHYYPEWHQLDDYQRDYAAEAAGY